MHLIINIFEHPTYAALGFSASYTKLDDLWSMHEGGYNLEAEA